MNTPGGALSKMSMVVFFILDKSGSMGNGKIQALNTAIREILPVMKEIEDDHGSVELYVMALAFSTGVEWIIAKMTRIGDISWPTLKAGGSTSMGLALKEVAKQLESPPLPKPCYSPACVLVSDGKPTDNMNNGLAVYNNSTFGPMCIRAAIGIGDDCDYTVLQNFIGNSEIKPLRADNPEELKDLFKMVTINSIKNSASPNSIKKVSPEGSDVVSNSSQSVTRW
jgi:uncharacterized protein YegL